MNQSSITTNTCTQQVLSAGKCLRTTRDWSFFCHWLVENVARDISANHQPMKILLTSSINYSSSPAKNASIEREIFHFKTVTSSSLAGCEAEEMVTFCTFHAPPFSVIVCGLSFNQGVLLFDAHSVSVIKGSSHNSSWKLRDYWKQRLVLRHFAGLNENGSRWIGFESTELTENCVFDEPIPKFVLTLFDTPHLFSCWVSCLASIPVYNSPLCVDRKHSVQLALV